MNILFQYLLRPLLDPLSHFYHIKIYNPIAQVLTTFLKNLSETKNLHPQHTSTPSAIQALLQTETFFDLLNIEQLRTIENNPQLATTSLGILSFKLIALIFLRNFRRMNSYILLQITKIDTLILTIALIRQLPISRILNLINSALIKVSIFPVLLDPIQSRLPNH